MFMRTMTLVLLVVLALLQYKLWLGEGGLQSLWETYHARAAQMAENQRLKERNESLAAEVADLQQGLEAVEERARSEMGMTKHDEKFYQIIDEGRGPR